MLTSVEVYGVKNAQTSHEKDQIAAPKILVAEDVKTKQSQVMSTEFLPPIANKNHPVINETWRNPLSHHMRKNSN